MVLIKCLGSSPDPRKDLKSRSPKLGPYATEGYLEGTPLRDLLFGDSRGSGIGFQIKGSTFQAAGRIGVGLRMK